jgi:hypothetical protein
MTIPSYDLFISHAEADRAWVEGYLLDALDRAGVRHHRETAFALGVPRIVEFENAVKDSRRILLVLSPAYFSNETAGFVDQLAQSFGLETSTWPVIPLVLEPTSLPTRLSMLTKLEATTPEDREDALKKLCALFQRPLPAPSPRPLCPYPGMRPFALDRDGQPNYPFFGRDQETDRLLQALRKTRFLTVIGSSGSGKSSLVLAGLVPRLRVSGLFGPGGWRIIVMRPTDEPLAELSKALGADPADPAGAAAHALAAQSDARHLLLVVDQLEELFTVARGDTRAFQQAVVRLAQVPDAHVVLTVRADFYDELMASALWPAIQRNRDEIAPLDEAGLREAIHKPAEAVGVYVESALVERLAADAAGSPGVLPLLQETLVLLWEKLERRVLPLRAYESLILTRSAYTIPDGEGYRTGLDVAIAQHAESVIASFTGTPRAEIARRIFLRLIQFGEGRPNTRRQQTVAQLRAGHDPVEFAQVLRHLTDNRLLTQSGDEQTGRRKADVAHEALIVGWPRLREWISEYRAAEEIRRELEVKASAWIAKGRGDAGLLDRVDLPAADQWLAGQDGRDLADADPIRDMIRASNAAIEETERRRQEAQQRELDDAKALADERKRRLETARRWAVAMGAALVILAGALVWAGLQTIWAKESETKAKKSESKALDAKKEADEAKQAAEKQAKIATSRQLAAASRSERSKRFDLSLLLAVEAFRFDNTFEARNSLLEAVQARPGLRSMLRVQEGFVYSVAFSPDGKTIAAGLGGGVLLFDAATRQRLPEGPLAVQEGVVFSVAFSHDGKTIAAGYGVMGGGGGVVLFDASARRRLSEGPFAVQEGVVSSVAFTPDSDGKTIAVGYGGVGVGGGVLLVDAVARQRLSEEPLVVQEGGVQSVAFSPDGNSIAAGYGVMGGGGGVVLFDAAARRRLPEGPLAVHEGVVYSVAFSPDPDGKTIAVGYHGGVVLFDAAARRRLSEGPLAVQEGIVQSVAFTPTARPSPWVTASAAAWCCSTRPREGACRRYRSSSRREASRAWRSAPTARPSPPDTAAAWCCSTRPGEGACRRDRSPSRRASSTAWRSAPTARPSLRDTAAAWLASAAAAWCCSTWPSGGACRRIRSPSRRGLTYDCCPRSAA